MKTHSVHDLADKMLEDFKQKVHTCTPGDISKYCGACHLTTFKSPYERYVAAFNYSHINAGAGVAHPYDSHGYALAKEAA